MRTLPDQISTIKLPSGAVAVDGHGYLTDPANWSAEFARHIARLEGISLTDKHFDVIRFMRAYLDEHGIAPDARFVLKYIAGPDALSKPESKQAMYALFPYGYVNQACRMAGMKQPRAWSTG